MGGKIKLCVWLRKDRFFFWVGNKRYGLNGVFFVLGDSCGDGFNRGWLGFELIDWYEVILEKIDMVKGWVNI